MASPRLSRSVAALVTAVILLGSGAVDAAHAATADPISHWDASSAACADVMFVGVRGSGEESGLGAPLEHVRDGVLHGYGIYPGVEDARSMRTVYLDYPAAPVSALADDLRRNLQNAVAGIPTSQWTWAYLQSIDTGAQELRDFLREEGARCPDEKWVLAGYSQGALVVNLVLSEFADYSRYGGVFLLANPGRHEGDRVREVGTAPAGGWGVGTLLWPDLQVPAELNGLVYSECDAYDAVCDTGNLIQSVVAGERGVTAGASYGTQVHTGYQGATLELDSRYIVEQLMGMAVPVSTSYEVLVEPGEERVGALHVKPLRDGVHATWRIKPGSTVPPGTVTDDGILVGTDGTYVLQVPEGVHVVRLEVFGEFEEHARDVTLTIRAGHAWQPVVFGDPQLELCMRAEFQSMAWYHATYPWLYPSFVEPAHDEPLMPADLRQLVGLECSNLTSLDGLQWATELGSLELTNLQTDDLSPLAGLSQLSTFQVRGGMIDDLSPLAGLTSLEYLYFWDAPITDLLPLRDLTGLRGLNLIGTDVVDLSPLAGMTEMDGLRIERNPRLADVTGLGSMAKLRTLSLRENPRLTSVAPLAPLTELTDLDMHDNDLTSLDGLQNMTKLEFLQASYNRIGSIAPLQNAVTLRQVHLEGNEITSVAPLAGKLGLQHLEIHGNKISDLTPIADLPSLSTLEASFNRITDLSVFAGNTTIRTVSASAQRIMRETATVGDSVTLPIIRTQNGAVLTPWIDTLTSGATATLTGDPAAGMTLTWTGPGYSVVRWEDPAGYFYGEYVVVDVTGAVAPAVTFSDVPTSYPFYSSISWMAERGISTGWVQADGSSQFRPTESVTREAMAAFLFRDMVGSGSYAPPVVSAFSDVPASYPFYKQIAWLAQQGISTGWVQADGSSQFRPTESVTREAMAAFLYRAAGSPAYTPPGVSPFTDVSTSYPFYKQIAWLAQQGISTGWVMPDGTAQFRPTSSVTREAMAAFLQRADTLLH